MPPTNMPPPGGWGQSISSDATAPLAEPTAERYHIQYPNILDHLKKLPVLLLASQYGGVGKSTMLRQAAEQLVLGTQVIFLPSVYTAFGLHPSLLWAYTNGGMVVISDTTYDCLERSVHFANQLLSGNPFIGLDQPVRAEQHVDFRLVIEYKLTVYPSRFTMNPVLHGCIQQVVSDVVLNTFLLEATLATQTERKALVELLEYLPVEERFSLHIYTMLRRLLTGEDRAGLLLKMLNNHPDVTTREESREKIALLLHNVRKSSLRKPAAPRAPKESAATEQHTPAQQAAALVAVVENFEHPTVKPAVDPVANLFGLEDELEDELEEYDDFDF